MRGNKRTIVTIGVAAAVLAISISSLATGASLKSLVKKEVAKQIAKKTGPAGPAGAPGAQGSKGAGIFAGEIPNPNACTSVEAAVGGPYQLNPGIGLSCSVTFPTTITGCTVTASVLNSGITVGGEVSARKLQSNIIEFARFDSAGANPDNDRFSFIVVCP